MVVPGHPGEVRALLRGAVGTLDAGSTYLRLSTESNREARPVSASLQMVHVRDGGRWWWRWACSDAVLEAVGDLDVTVAYATTVRPFDAVGLRSLEASSGAVVLVEPYGGNLRVRGVVGAGFAAAPAAEPGRPAHRTAAVRDAR